MVTEEMEGTEIFHISFCHSVDVASSINNLSDPSGAFITINETALTYFH